MEYAARIDGSKVPVVFAIAMLALLTGCRGMCTSANDCYNEALGGESQALLAGGTVTWVGRYTENHHPVSYGVRFLNLDYDGLARAKPIKLTLPEPVAELQPFIEGERVALVRSGAATNFVLTIERPQGDTVTVAIPAGDVLSRKTVSGPIHRPEHAKGWYPERYCVSYIKEEVGPATTIGIDQFALPQQTPPAPPNSGDPDDVYGC